jgi:hypothetical protein
MSKIALSGNASGTGTFTLASPNSSTDRTLDLPDASGVIDRLNRAGNVLQVVSADYGTSGSTTSTSWTTTNLTTSITPSSASNKILVVVSLPVNTNSLGTNSARYTIFRGTTAGTNLGNVNAGFSVLVVFSGVTGYYNSGTIAMNYLDSPSTTSSQTYTVAARSEGGSSAAGWCTGSATATLTLMEIAA